MNRNVKQLLFGGPDQLPVSGELGLLVLRASTGLTMAFAHGIGKIPPQDGFVDGVGEMGFPVPVVFAWLSGIAEFVGALLIVVGLLTRPAALLLAINMAVAFFIAHGDDPFDVAELAMVFGCVALSIMLIGSGRFSVDRMIR